MSARKNRNGIGPWTPYHNIYPKEFRQEFVQASSIVCAFENGWAVCPPLPGLIYESMNSASLTLRAHKKGIAVLAQSFWGWGLKKEFWTSSLFFTLLIFLAEVIVLLSPLVHLAAFFGWWLLSCHHTLLTVERITPMALLYVAQSAAGAGRAKHVNISCI